MKCEEIKNKLTSYLLGDLDKETASLVEKHLEECEVCRAELDGIEPTLDILRAALAVPSAAQEKLSDTRKAEIILEAQKPAEKQMVRFDWWITRSHPRLAMAASIVIVIGFLWAVTRPILHKSVDEAKVVGYLPMSSHDDNLRMEEQVAEDTSDDTFFTVVNGADVNIRKPGEVSVLAGETVPVLGDIPVQGRLFEKQQAQPAVPPAKPATTTAKPVNRPDSWTVSGIPELEPAAPLAPAAVVPPPASAAAPEADALVSEAAWYEAKKVDVSHESVPLKYDMPKPLFVGTPKTIRTDNLETADDYSSRREPVTVHFTDGVAAPVEEAPVAIDTPADDFSPEPAQFDSVAIVKSPVIMNGVYGNRTEAGRASALREYADADNSDMNGTVLADGLEKNVQEDTTTVHYRYLPTFKKPMNDGKDTLERDDDVDVEVTVDELSKSVRDEAKESSALNLERNVEAKEERRAEVEAERKKAADSSSAVEETVYNQAPNDVNNVLKDLVVLGKLSRSASESKPAADITPEKLKEESAAEVLDKRLEYNGPMSGLASGKADAGGMVGGWKYANVDKALTVVEPGKDGGFASGYEKRNVVAKGETDSKYTLALTPDAPVIKSKAADRWETDKVADRGRDTMSHGEKAADSGVAEVANGEIPVSGLPVVETEGLKAREDGAPVLKAEALDREGRVKAGQEVLEDAESTGGGKLAQDEDGEGNKNVVRGEKTPVVETDELTGPVFKAWGVNNYVATVENSFSTFAIDVDTAAYTVMRNYASRGMLPPAESVRTEEFVNFFDYSYNQPRKSTFEIHADCAPSHFGRGQHLLKLGIKGRKLGREEQRHAVITLLIDASGSMEQPDRMGLVVKSLQMLLDRLDPKDQVAIVQYASEARLVMEHTPAGKKKEILTKIKELSCGGSTNLEKGMGLAYQVASSGFVGGGENRVIIMSDGAANLGSTEAENILKQVEGSRKQGVFCSVLGFGMGTYNDAMLEELANKGDGTYSFIDSVEEAERVLVQEFSSTLNTIARDVKIQVEFNKDRVKKYRQMGYENRQLQAKDFRDDAVDAGEVGSGQSVTALYELELNPDSNAHIGIVRVRYRRVDTGKVEEISRGIKPSDLIGNFDEADARFKLAASAAEFAEILRGSPFAQGSEFEDVAQVLRPVALELTLDKQVQEFLRIVSSAHSFSR